MSKLIPGSSVNTLEADSQNIVEIIRKEYEKITTSIKVNIFILKALQKNLLFAYLDKRMTPKFSLKIH